MAGRGNPFANLKKKEEEAPEKKDEEVFLLSDDMQTLTVNPNLPTIGRGRGLNFLSKKDSSSKSQGIDIDSFLTGSKSGSGSASGGISRGAGRGIAAHHYSDDRWDDEDPGTPSTERKMSLGVGSGRGRGMISITSDSPKISQQSTTDDQSDMTGSRGPETSYSRDGQGDGPQASSSGHTARKALPYALKKHGDKGRVISAFCNCIPLIADPNKGIFEYEVKFEPSLDSIRSRAKCLNQGVAIFGEARTFDGHVLQLPIKLNDDLIKFEAIDEISNAKIQVTLRYQKQVRMGDHVKFYNLLFERVFKILQYLRDGKKVFNPREPPIIPQFKLEVWPGYVKAVEELEGGLMLTLDVSHRILATTTIYDKYRQLSRQQGSAQDSIKKSLIGRVVITRYNNKSYRIDDFDFTRNALMEFEHCGKMKTVAEYYKEQYNIIVQDPKQFLIVSKVEQRIPGQREKHVQIVHLLPELCHLTGLYDDQKSNFTIKKELATYTQLTPFNRIAAYKRFIDNVYNSPQALKVLSDWGLSLDRESAKTEARVLDEQKVIFGRNKEIGVGPKADFSNAATSNEVLLAVDIEKWAIICSKGDAKLVDKFEKGMMELSRPTGVRVKNAIKKVIDNDRTETYCSAIRAALMDNPGLQIVVIIFPTARDDRYAAVKKILCSEIPTPSQCVQAKTINDDRKFRSVMVKIILQMNVKLGGALWGVKLPFKRTMICGMDTYHDSTINVGGFVASINEGFTHYFSRPAIQQGKEELINGLSFCFESALKCYENKNNFLPDSIIVYRDGVSEGQLDHVRNYEIEQFRKTMKKIDPHYNPKLTFIVVQKRVNTKFFMEVKKAKTEMCNMPPGTIIDKRVTHRTLYDFYLVSQHVNQGSTTPSHYVVLTDENDFPADVMQRITFKLCFMYYNWPGTVRVPAPCQYAHKLADLVGESVKQQVGIKLCDKLFFL